MSTAMLLMPFTLISGSAMRTLANGQPDGYGKFLWNHLSESFSDLLLIFVQIHGKLRVGIRFNLERDIIPFGIKWVNLLNRNAYILRLKFFGSWYIELIDSNGLHLRHQLTEINHREFRLFRPSDYPNHDFFPPFFYK